MKIIGHRGARGLAAENTLQGIKKAMSLGVDEIEFDVRVTADDIPVVIHDNDLKRLTDAETKIAKTTYAQLKKIKSDLPTLDELLDTVNRQVHLMIEVKPHVATPPIIKVLKKRLANGWKPTDFMIGSFSQRTLEELHEALPAVGTVVIGHWSGVRLAHRARKLNTKYVSMDQRWLWWGFIRSVAHRGYKLYTYTLNDPKKAARWQRAGLYGVISDYPDRFKDFK